MSASNNNPLERRGGRGGHSGDTSSGFLRSIDSQMARYGAADSCQRKSSVDDKPDSVLTSFDGRKKRNMTDVHRQGSGDVGRDSAHPRLAAWSATDERKDSQGPQVRLATEWGTKGYFMKRHMGPPIEKSESSIPVGHPCKTS